MGNWDEFVRTGGWDAGARLPMALGGGSSRQGDGGWPGRQRLARRMTNPHPAAPADNGRHAPAFPCRPVHSQPHLLGREAHSGLAVTLR